MEAAILDFFEIIDGSDPGKTYRLLATNSEGVRSMAIFEFGSRESLAIVSASAIGEGDYFCSLRLRVGGLRDNTALTLQRLNDFLAGKYINSEPRGYVDLEEDSEVWIEFDTLTSLLESEPLKSREELVTQLVIFFEEALMAESSIDEWQTDLNDHLTACESSTGSKDALEDPQPWRSFRDDLDKDDREELKDREVTRMAFIQEPELAFNKFSEAVSYLAANYPMSLQQECFYDGQKYFFDAALNRINDKVYGFKFEVTSTFE